MLKKTSWLIAAAIAAACGGAAHADWKPTKPVEFVVTSGPGGGTDNFARMVQSIIAKHKLMDQPVVVTNKGGGSGAEGFVYAKAAAGDPHKLIFGTNNDYLLPLRGEARLQARRADAGRRHGARRVPALGQQAMHPTRTPRAIIEAAKAKPDTLKMGGSQSKDTDQTLTA